MAEDVSQVKVGAGYAVAAYTFLGFCSGLLRVGTICLTLGNSRLSHCFFLAPSISLGLADQDYLCGEFTLVEVPMMSVSMVWQLDGLDTSNFPRLFGTS